MKLSYLIWTIAPSAFAIFFVLCAPDAEARKIRTKHSISKTTEIHSTGTDNSLTVFNSDSIEFEEKIKPAIRFYGFDKTAGSNVESFFISNNLDMPVESLEIEIIYFDMKGRQLHKRNVQLEGTIASGETIRRDIKSWDTQKSFYFHQSAKPKRQATPFKVKINLLSASFEKKTISQRK